MRVRVVTGVSLRQWKTALRSRRPREFWRRLVRLALPRNRDRCPKCGSKDFLRSRRKNFIEFGISKLVLPYRCSHCYRRFFRAVQAAEIEDPNRYRMHDSGLQQARRT
jgi:DNA-directed RNA polymerase subunit RPC12/RpoP